MVEQFIHLFRTYFNTFRFVKKREIPFFFFLLSIVICLNFLSFFIF